jgi:GNAT superfamily N-acetyltransferase
MIHRNGDHVARRLAECSLYRPELDLAVYTPTGDVAAYGLFWADPVTGIGLVEPMRTEDAYQGRGLARHVLTSGLDRLAAHGCSSLKVSYIDGNDAARRLYLGAGFVAGPTTRTYRLSK